MLGLRAVHRTKTFCINRGAVRPSTFTDDRDYQAFLDVVAEAFRLWGIEVFAYSLMRNDYHLCLRTPKGNLSRVMRHVDGIDTQRFIHSELELP